MRAQKALGSIWKDKACDVALILGLSWARWGPSWDPLGDLLGALGGVPGGSREGFLEGFEAKLT